jgi:DNA polymerase I-like protein with 3'-5' exonuclease and polymerase domains
VQNVPRGHGIRDAFIVPKGYAFAKFDLASIEARLGAHAMSVFAHDDTFSSRYRQSDQFNIYLHVVRECTGHGEITKKDPLYQAYKHAVLGIQYGVGPDTFAKTLREKFALPYSPLECDAIYAKVKSRFPQFRRLQRAMSSIVEKQGYILDDFGAIYYVPENERYKAVNYYAQGCAGNILKWWITEIWKILGPKDYGCNLVHDEIDMALWRDRGAKSRGDSYCKCLEKLDLFSLPITAEWSGLVNNWAEAG